MNVDKSVLDCAGHILTAGVVSKLNDNDIVARIATQQRCAERIQNLLDSRTKELREALRGLVRQLEWIHEQPQYLAVWQMHQIHGGDYSKGPSYEKELAIAKQVLASSPDQG